MLGESPPDIWGRQERDGIHAHLRLCDFLPCVRHPFLGSRAGRGSVFLTCLQDEALNARSLPAGWGSQMVGSALVGGRGTHICWKRTFYPNPQSCTLA